MLAPGSLSTAAGAPEAAWLGSSPSAEDSVRALCAAPVRASANPDALVTETQPRVKVQVPALVQQGLGAAPSSDPCPAALQMCSASLCCPCRVGAEAGPCCLPHSCCPAPSQGSLPGHSRGSAAGRTGSKAEAPAELLSQSCRGWEEQRDSAFPLSTYQCSAG